MTQLIQCTACHQLKPTDQFGVRKDTPTGYSERCNPCIRAVQTGMPIRVAETRYCQCGAKMSSYNLGELCWPCEKRQVREIGVGEGTGLER